MARLTMFFLESSALLAFFYLIYVLLLRRETFFNLNRLFLIVILVFSLLFPLLSFEVSPFKVAVAERPIDEISKFRMSYYEALASWDFDYYNSSSHEQKGNTIPKLSTLDFDWVRLAFNIVLVVYSVGVLICLSRTAWTLRWIRRMIAIYPHQDVDGIKIINIPHAVSPFSFFKYVFVHDVMVGSREFDQILAHEKTHIQERHSFDLIFVQLLAAFFWFNPVIWQLIKSLKATHEYIADKKIISSGYSLVEYQTLLLNQLVSNNSFGLVHNFNLSFIKKRITMMKHKESGWQGRTKVAVAITGTLVVGFLIVQCNSKLEEPAPDNYESTSSGSKDFTGGVNLPQLPETGFVFEGDTKDALNVVIRDNRLTIDGKQAELNEIVPLIEKEGVPSLSGFTILRIDKDQSMALVRKVHMELRRADRRKVLYIGQTANGAKVETPLVLPHFPNGASSKADEMIGSGKLALLKIDLGDKGAANQQMVYDFVQEQISKKSTDYVVSARFDNDDSYDDFLVNLVSIKEGFNQIYQERSRAMFGKDYYKVSEQEFKSVREGVPMAISVSEEEGTIGSY